MATIFETKSFVVEAFDKPHVSREEGGHIKIFPKQKISNRTEMSPAMAIEFIRLTMIVGKAFEQAMKNRGLEIMRINYHDMGNWAYKSGKQPVFHLHIYGRAKNAVHQPFREAVYLPDRSTGFYDAFKPLNETDIAEIRKQINIVAAEEKYQDKNWL
ncbi:MAG: hypothetical protein PHY34_06170 [Patescibacteria group bacterium]|nr:hypothetical protein [Patescibacteria group bacterium]MDD5715782.1 hypothetical protein [Patescibacteria group bacterium]